MPIEILSERIIDEQQAVITRERYLSGWHPERGVLTMGYTGEETIEKVQGVKPALTVEVFESDRKILKRMIEEFWYERWDYPIQWSIEVAGTNCALADEHRKRLRVFHQELQGVLDRDTV